MSETKELRTVLLSLILRYKAEKDATLKESYEHCEGWARKVYNHPVFPSFESFDCFMKRNRRRKKMTPEDALSEEISELFQDIRYPVDEGSALQVFQRDSDGRKHSRMNECDFVILREEERVRRKYIVALIGRRPKRKRWTLDEIRSDCECKRRRTQKSFFKESRCR